MVESKTPRETIARMSFAKIYPLYVNKVERKGRTVDELNEVIGWLTGFDEAKIRALIERDADFETLFEEAEIHPNASLIKGVICGYRVEDLSDPFIQKARYMDKLVDELAKGRKMEKILRTA